VRLFEDILQLEQQETPPAPSPAPMLRQSVLYEWNKCQEEMDEVRAELHCLQNRFELPMKERGEMRSELEKARTD
jgi:hypothetical protein